MKAVETQPNHTTFLAMLAITQAQRNKLLSAVLNATKAADLEPKDVELAKLAIRTLLDSGRHREAASRLQAVENLASGDKEICMMIVRLHLMRRQYDEARRAAQIVRQTDSSSQWLIRLGDTFESARQDECAAEFYQEVLASGHYPEALLGLARVAANDERLSEARGLLVRALDLTREAGPKGRTAVEMSYALVSQLALLDEPIADCKAWIVTFPPNATPAALAGRSLMVYALSRYNAEKHLDFVLEAMQPGTRVNSAALFKWREAPADRQPARPVREGIQLVM